MFILTGKEKCKYLKELRAEIAEKHGIDGFQYKECDFMGECVGTCPACDAEANALYEILQERNLTADTMSLKEKEIMIKECIRDEQLFFSAADIDREPGVMVMDDDSNWQKVNTHEQQKPELLMGKVIPIKHRERPVPKFMQPQYKGILIRDDDDKEKSEYIDEPKDKPRGLRGLFKKKK